MDQIPITLRKKMDNLLDDKFIKNFFDGNLKMFFPEAEKIKKIKKEIRKDVRGKYDYSLIIEFSLSISLQNKKIITTSVFSKTHSDEKKNKSIYYMEFLYKNGFGEGLYRVPRPLIYIPGMRTGFYEGVRGKNLLSVIHEKNYKRTEIILEDSAHWIAKLHNLKFKAHALELPVARIKDNQPPIETFFASMRKNYFKLYKEFVPLYNATLSCESHILKTLKTAEKTRLIYADYHPENIIIPRYSTKGVTVIDFTDLAWGDPLKDIGTFLQQLFFMPKRYNIYLTPKICDRWQKIFLEAYSNDSGSKIDWQRIDLYRTWTCLRNVIYFYYKKDPKQFIWGLIEEAKEYLARI